GTDRVLDVAETTRLRPVSVDLERAAGKRGCHEARDDHPVLAALPRADRVEEPHDDAVETALLVIREREELVHRLRLGVRPAARGRRPVHARAPFRERLRLAPVAVHLRGGGDEDALAEAVAVIEHVLGALDVRHERVHRLLDDEADADRSGEVVHDVAAVNELVHDGRLHDRFDHEVEAGALAQMGHVPLRAGREVVEDEDLLALVEEKLGEVGADEAGAARDESAAQSRAMVASRRKIMGLWQFRAFSRPVGWARGTTSSSSSSAWASYCLWC